MTASDAAPSDPVRLHVVAYPSLEQDPASCIPGDPASGMPVEPGTIASLFRADEGDRPRYDDPAVLRAGGSGQTYAGVAEPGPPLEPPGAFDHGHATADGE